ncbi:unnamed protein product [Rotaria sp. Silwood2]|nr:unnamed protein product [Rotaria sp. Silwood2]
MSIGSRQGSSNILKTDENNSSKASIKNNSLKIAIENQNENNSSTTPVENTDENNSSPVVIENQNENNSSTTPIENTDENNSSPVVIENQNENNSSTTPVENTDENNSSPVVIENQNDDNSSITTMENKDEYISSEIPIENKDENQLNTEINDTNSRTSSLKITRSQSHSSKTSERNESSKMTNIIISERPLSPIIRHRIIKHEKLNSTNQQRTRSNSPRKTFSYLTPDRFNLRYWKQQRRQLAKQEEDDRIYHENRQKLERLARIAKEPSTYPSIHIEQERLRERHVIDYRRKVLKSHIPILRENLSIVNRLANVKGVYDVKKMNEDYTRHTLILKQDAANRQKARETAEQRPFILPKINVKS